MNIAIKNENLSIMNSLDTDIIKTLNGNFTKQDIELEFANLYYNKVIIDITAIKNYYDEETLFSFLNYFEASKVILVLNNTEFCDNPSFLKKLVEKGYYNFSKNLSQINLLVNKPNTFEDVKKYLEGANLNNPLNANEITAQENYHMNKNEKQKVIGIQNLTKHTGATTLMYMIVKMLKSKYSVKGIEISTKDSIFFQNEDIITSPNLEDTKIKVKTLYNYDVIIIDLNNNNGLDICTDILYLIDPGIINLNKLLKSGQNISELSNKAKIVLNRSALSSKEVESFQYETRIKVFANLNAFNERSEKSNDVAELLHKLNINVY